mmetsp:Transcript_19373/g.49254  ORF Transcript_19373/g.49254 Transcript_19373/m.49254 type:complete len:219 (+) Transcript_19373:60-716(+)
MGGRERVGRGGHSLQDGACVVQGVVRSGGVRGGGRGHCELRNFVIQRLPLLNDAQRVVQLGRLCHGVVAKVDSLGLGLGRVIAPRFTPQPFLREAEDGDLVLQVVGQVLVQVGQAVGVPAEAVVDGAEAVTRGREAEALEVYHIQRADVVRQGAQVGLPVARVPKAKARHFRAALAKRHISIHLSFQVHVHEFHHVGPHHLVGIHKNDAIDCQRKQHV